MESQQQPSLTFDSFDVDLLVKVLSHTVLSPFFAALIPVFYIFHGAAVHRTPIVLYLTYFCAISIFWLVRWYDRLWRNQGSLFYGPGWLDWGEQVVLITGGSSGVGELLANTLAVRNVNVVVLDVKPILTENYNITFYECDVSNWEDVERVSKEVIQEIGNPTVIVNNAGVAQGKLITDLTPEDVKQTFGVNTLAHFWTLKAFLPAMIKAKTGHIITMSSVMGMVGCAQMTDYAASKAALVSLHESLRYELDKRYKTPKIRTTLVLPGHITTPLFCTIRFPQTWFHQFFLPSLAPVSVVKAVIAALDEQHSRKLYMPFYVHFAPALRLMPSFIRDAVQWISGADFAMRNFVKVSGRRPEEGPALDMVYNDWK